MAIDSPHAIPRDGDRRTSSSPLRLPERRSGFDRRQPSGWRSRYESDLQRLAGRPRTLLLIIATIVVFNLVDFILTLRVLEAGGSELNPIMDRLIATNARVAASVKMGLVGAVALTLFAMRRYRRTLQAAIFVLVAFSALMFWHVYLALRIAAT